MNRLQKKCFIAATGFHLLLVLILVVGPAFLSSSSSKPVDVPVIDFIPVKTVDALISGGGSRTGGSPPHPEPEPPAPQPQPPQVASPPAPQPQAAPPPEVKTVKPVKQDPPTPDSSLKPSPRKVEVSTKIVRRPGAAEADKARAEQAKAEAAARRERAAQIGKSISAISAGLTPTTSIELSGPGGGGVPYANFLSAVRKYYADAWVVPQGVDDSAAATASITIGRDGRVISSYISTPSGDPVVDQSVQAVLNRVRRVAPLPDTAKEDQRTVKIVFDVKAKLLG